jgi:hypothetical protein
MPAEGQTGDHFLKRQTKFCSVADPDPGSGAFLTQGSGSAMNKNPEPGSGMNIPDHISESLETIFGLKLLEFFDAYPGSRTEKNSDPGLASRIRSSVIT